LKHEEHIAMSRNAAAAVVHTVGVDTGKNTLHLIGLDDQGAIVLREKVSRGRIAARLANVPQCLIGIEAGMATHYVARELIALGHDVKQVPPAYAGPFRQGHKNDFRDAHAIAEAVQWPSTRCVPVKTDDLAFTLFVTLYARARAAPPPWASSASRPTRTRRLGGAAAADRRRRFHFRDFGSGRTIDHAAAPAALDRNQLPGRLRLHRARQTAALILLLESLAFTLFVALLRARGPRRHHRRARPAERPAPAAGRRCGCGPPSPIPFS
jgi:transposase